MLKAVKRTDRKKAQKRANVNEHYKPMILNRQSSIINHQSKAFSPEEYLLVLAARLEMNSNDAARMESILREGPDWAEVKASAHRSGVETLLYRHLSQQRYARYVPDEVMHLLKESYRVQAIRSLRIYGQISRILNSMNQADVPIILLKGAFLAKWVYGDIALRPMNDIDILCRDKDTAAAQKILRGLGYEQKRNIAQSRFHEQVSLKKASHLPPLLKHNAVRVEIHTNLFTRAPYKTHEMERVWKKAIPCQLNSQDVYCLLPEHQILYLSFHLHKHLMSGSVILNWFCDIHEFVEHYSEKINWNQFQTIAESLGIGSWVAALYDLLIREWNTSIPKNVAPSLDADFIGLSLKSAIFGNRVSTQLSFLPSRIQRLRDIGNEDGWGRSFYYVLRHLFPARSYIINRYNPRNQRKMWGYYVFHLYWRFRHAVVSLFYNLKGLS